MAFESEPGAQVPLGFWDPLGLSAAGNVTFFRRCRSVALKHGRISMLATMGHFTPENIRTFPGVFLRSVGFKFAAPQIGLAAISQVPTLDRAWFVAYAGFVEVSAGSDDQEMAALGDFGFKILMSIDPAEGRKKLSVELANSHLAMAAVVGMLLRDGLTGRAWGDKASQQRFSGKRVWRAGPRGLLGPAGLHRGRGLAFVQAPACRCPWVPGTPSASRPPAT